MEFGLPDGTCSTVRQILASYPQIEKAVLYGSRAKGNYKAGSDIDLTLFGTALNHTLLMSISTALEESDIPYTVDLSLFDQIETPTLREHIERVGQVFYERGRVR
ncbi:nucleotidyltransferase domain-containing protein [Zoogloea sp.]|uniref:nucleotidyltransferase domain-containing protein n=1 Tax=Zoogloea sp. TaxID=49181 RepID=UPI001AC47149|nr:nucleotidyltransferase domain-containing protein [Zoogloea sp.]MBN8285014.1 nucleotidyltransferase domain-containing protein [Zoogloea sp.]